MFLQMAGGALGAFCAGLSQAAAGKPEREGKARSVILIFNSGAPSHIDLWDPKPNAPETVRGPYKPIRTSVSGTQVSELLPRLAKQAHRYAIVRTVHHAHTQHNSGMYWSIVGRPYRVDSTLINPSRADIPSFGTLVGWLSRRDGWSADVPPYVITPFPHCDSTVYITPGQYGSCLGAKYDPFVLNADPNARDYQPAFGGKEPNDPVRLGERRSLLTHLDGSPRRNPAQARELETTRDAAFSLVGSAKAREAFDLSREPAVVRDRYGRHSWGQSHLLARRLVEAGCRFVTIENGHWDTHRENTRSLRDVLVPSLDRALSALVADLDQRGLLDSTLVVLTTEFGRTPRINTMAGRDHWPNAFSIVMAGGGTRPGVVIGATDKIGAAVTDRPITPPDMAATILHALGIDPSTTLRTALGRPVELAGGGKPVTELFGA